MEWDRRANKRENKNAKKLFVGSQSSSSSSAWAKTSKSTCRKYGGGSSRGRNISFAFFYFHSSSSTGENKIIKYSHSRFQVPVCVSARCAYKRNGNRYWSFNNNRNYKRNEFIERRAARVLNTFWAKRKRWQIKWKRALCEREREREHPINGKQRRKGWLAGFGFACEQMWDVGGECNLRTYPTLYRQGSNVFRYDFIVAQNCRNL